MADFEKQMKERAKELKDLMKKGMKVVGDSWKKGWSKGSGLAFIFVLWGFWSSLVRGKFGANKNLVIVKDHVEIGQHEIPLVATGTIQGEWTDRYSSSSREERKAHQTQKFELNSSHFPKWLSLCTPHSQVLSSNPGQHGQAGRSGGSWRVGLTGWFRRVVGAMCRAGGPVRAIGLSACEPVDLIPVEIFVAGKDRQKYFSYAGFTGRNFVAGKPPSKLYPLEPRIEQEGLIKATLLISSSVTKWVRDVTRGEGMWELEQMLLRKPIHIKSDCPKLKATPSKEKVEEKPMDRSHTRPRKSTWYLDSSCLKHMTRDTAQFISLEAMSGGKVTLGDNITRKVVGSDLKESYLTAVKRILRTNYVRMGRSDQLYSSKSKWNEQRVRVIRRKIDIGEHQKEKNIALKVDDSKSDQSQPKDEENIALMIRQFKSFLKGSKGDANSGTKDRVAGGPIKIHPPPPSSRKISRHDSESSPPAFGDNDHAKDINFWSMKERPLVITEGGMVVKKKAFECIGKGKSILIEDGCNLISNEVCDVESKEDQNSNMNPLITDNQEFVETTVIVKEHNGTEQVADLFTVWECDSRVLGNCDKIFHIAENSKKPVNVNFGINVWKKKANIKVSELNYGKDFVEEDGVVKLNSKKEMDNCIKLKKSLVIKFFGDNVPFHVISLELRRQWGRYGKFHLTQLGLGWVLCAFEDLDTLEEIIDSGPWYVNGNIVGMDRWTVVFSPSSFEGLTAPIWIQMPNLPLQCWDEFNVCRIASMVGTLYLIDGNMFQWSRREFLGHLKEDCSKRVSPSILTKPAMGNQVNEDVLVEATKLKHKGLKAITNNGNNGREYGHWIQAAIEFLIMYVDVEEKIVSEDNVEPPNSERYGTSTQVERVQVANTSSDIENQQTQDPPLASAQTVPSYHYDYETMSSGSSEQCSDDEGADLLPVVNDGDAVDNEEIRIIVQDYCSRSVGSTDTMVANNDYAETCRTTEEWDKEVDIDADYDAVIVEDEFSIPNDLIEGMCFTRKTDMQFALQGWAIKNNVQYIVIASNRNKFTIVCTKHDCPVYPCLCRLHSAQSKRLGGIWKISSLKNQHRCVSPILDSGHRQYNSQFISFYILPTIRKQMDLKPREIIGRMESKFNIKVSYMKAWDARRKAIKVVFGSWEESYRTLNLFMDVVASVMPGMVYRIQSTQTNRFQRLFWAFDPSISGWKYCRPVLSLDGTFLLGKYRGTLLTAIGMDANNGLYPLAFAVVESEYRHAGLVRGCREIFPNVAHRHCLRHLRENFRKAIRQMGIGDVDFLCQKMYAAGNTDDKAFFNKCMEDMRRIKVNIHQWLVDRDVSRWSLINDGGFRFGVTTTNAAESFNGVLKRARGLPIQALITAIYYNIISMFMGRLEFIATEEQQNNNFFAPRVQTLLKKVEEEAR
ncbi:hypothetical protein KFK09_017692 [Dendrobium nobile]|uniref:Transposase n=1 Tax=Dendrobium nobile TaxID=94219 RepID=A0A8T3ATR5_DENNO|nr:hypothetical protein KFK09_017692 [Dendrobium nobile]